MEFDHLDLKETAYNIAKIYKSHSQYCPSPFYVKLTNGGIFIVDNYNMMMTQVRSNFTLKSRKFFIRCLAYCMAPDDTGKSIYHYFVVDVVDRDRKLTMSNVLIHKPGLLFIPSPFAYDQWSMNDYVIQVKSCFPCDYKDILTLSSMDSPTTKTSSEECNSAIRRALLNNFTLGDNSIYWLTKMDRKVIVVYLTAPPLD